MITKKQLLNIKFNLKNIMSEQEIEDFEMEDESIESEGGSGDFAKLASILLHSQTQVHTLHLQTQSYSEHKALQGYYEGIDALVDGIIESFQGKYGILKDYKMVGSLKDLNNDEEIIKYFETLARYCELKREKLPQDGFLKNQYDTVDEFISSTIYKLKFLG